MTTTGRRHRLSLIAMLSMSCLSALGCEGMRTSEFFARHISNEDKNVVARKRWNDFRGNVRLQMAEQHLQAGRYQEAEEVLTEASELIDEEPEVLRLFALLHYETGELTRARTEIEQYMALVPDDVEGRALGGRIASRAGRIDDAIMWYRSAVELAPDEPSYRVKLSECLMARGASAQALSVIENAPQFELSLPMRQLAMEICDARNDVDGAGRHARVVAQLALEDSRARERAGIVLSNAGAHADAVAVLGPLVQTREVVETIAVGASDEGDAVFPLEAIHAYAKSCLELNRDKDALGVLKRAIREDASDQVSWSLYCRTAIRSGDLPMALDIVATFNRRNAPIPEMLVLEAYVHFLQGDLTKARETADRALEIDPGFEPAFLLKAKARNDASPRRSIEAHRPEPQRAVTIAPRCKRLIKVADVDRGRQWYLNPTESESQVAVLEEEFGR